MDHAQPGAAGHTALGVRKGRATKVVPPEVADAIRLMQIALRTDPELGLFLRLAAVLGARRGELCSLRWPDVERFEQETASRAERSAQALDHPGRRRSRRRGRRA